MSHSLVQNDWKENHVYLVTYPRCGIVPNGSPWSLKLETWLRFAQIPYTGISSQFKRFSQKGQVPFVELNGREIADSGLIIEALKVEFNKARSDLDSSDPEKIAMARAITALAEDSMVWRLFAFRSKDISWITHDDGWGRYFGTGLMRWLGEYFVNWKIGGRWLHALMVQGTGRNSDAEIEDMARKDFDALSTLLGEKPFFFGDKPSTIDCTVFGHLAGFIYTHSSHPIPVMNLFMVAVKHIKETRPNLMAFLERMKERFWPDWEETCRTMDMNTHHKLRGAM